MCEEVQSARSVPQYYCHLLKRMQMVCTVWVESIQTGHDGRRKTFDRVKKLGSVSLRDVLSADRHLLSASFATSLKSKL